MIRIAMAFRNQQAFDDPASKLGATGVNTRKPVSITDSRGNALAHLATGGLISPVRHEVRIGAKIFRFGAGSKGAAGVAAGAWWLDQEAFDHVYRAAQVWELSIGMAARLLCLVPPEWSDMTLLVRARALEPLLAWRGLANSVVTPAKGGGPKAQMPHQNETPSRRLSQLYIPGLGAPMGTRPAIQIEQEFPLDKDAGLRGFLYL